MPSMKGDKLEAFQKHLCRVNVDSDFNFEWKEVVERKVSMTLCSSLSEVCKDEVLDRGIEKRKLYRVG